MALARGASCWRSCQGIGRSICALQHGAIAASSTGALSRNGTPISEGSGRHISSSAFCHAASRKSAQQEGHSKASSALTHARKESRLQQRADSWIEVVHKETGQVYYWNEHTNETTALGEPKPGPEGRQPVQQQVVMSRETSLLGLVGVGAGIGLTFAIIGRLLGG